MKNRILKAFLKGLTVLACGLGLAAMIPIQAYAYNYSRPSAFQTGTVTIQEIAGGNAVNGYSTSGGYQVTYTIEDSNWVAFYDIFGGYFLMGNDLDPAGGCHFAYSPSGTPWQDGAIVLGMLSDGMQAARCDVENNTVSHSFTVSSLDQLPTYIAYAYEPASSAYIHITEERGTNGHIWYYDTLRDKAVQSGENIDSEPPSLSVSVVPKGTVVNVGGKTWSTAADITVSATDNKARPEGIRIYSGNSLLKEIKNTNNAVSVQGTYGVTKNGTYQADAYDKLNNTSNKTAVSVSCIDLTGPVIQSLVADTTEFSREVTLKAIASDGGCGLHEKAYSWNNGTFSAATELKVTKNGTYTLRVRDALGNESTKSITVSNIDEDAPEITYKVRLTGKQTTYQGVLWATGARISAEASDEKSGVANFWLMQKDGEVLSEKSSKLKEEKLIIEELDINRGTYGFTAVDMAGNTAKTEWIALTHLDNEAPIIKEIKNTKAGNGSVVVSVSAQDAPGGIGLADMAYSFDGGKTWQKGNTYTVEKNGTYEIAVRDRLGQISTKTQRVTEVVVPKSTDGTEETGKSPEPASDPSDQSNPPDQSDRSDSDSSKKAKRTEVTEKSTVSGNEFPFDYVEKRVEVSLDDALAEAEKQDVEEVYYEVESQHEKVKKADPVTRTIAAVLGLLFLLGCLGLVLYLLLFYLQHSCVLYELDDAKDRKRLCRLLIHKDDKNWLIKVPDHKLGLSGTGNYLLLFHPSFLKEDEPDAVIIEIDGKTLREKPVQEVYFAI